MAAAVCSQMFLGAMKSEVQEESCRRYFFPELLNFLNGLIQRISMLQNTEELETSPLHSLNIDNLIYLLLFSTERVIISNATSFRSYLLKSLISFISLMGHNNVNIASEVQLSVTLGKFY